MRAGIIIIAALVALAGCNAEQLRYTTLRLGQTIPELQERQVVDNLARIAASPGNLPYYTVVNTGTANILDTGGSGLGALTFQHHVGTLASLNAAASRAVTGNWTLNPMANPDRLRAMRAAYNVALGAEIIDPLDASKLDAIMRDQNGLSIPRGWLQIGTKHEVPREANIVSHCGHTYVWVTPERAKDFADFALLILNIATWVPPSPHPTLNVTVDKIAPITFGYTTAAPAPLPEAIPGARAAEPGQQATQQPHPIQRRLYEDSQSINRGLFFVPR